MPADPIGTTTPRARFREQVRRDAKDAALSQIAAGGPEAISVNAIAKGLGVSGPALYRYFAGRDDLLDALVLDAYDDLGDAVAEAVGGASGNRAAAYAAAYRAWAVREPHRYRLLFGQPAAGHDGHRVPLVEAATRRLMVLLLEVVGELPGPAPEVAAAAREPLAAWATSRSHEVDPAVAARAISAWARLHGWVRLEIDGNFRSMGLEVPLLMGDPFA